MAADQITDLKLAGEDWQLERRIEAPIGIHDWTRSSKKSGNISSIFIPVL
jgi:hypothetical protein